MKFLNNPWVICGAAIIFSALLLIPFDVGSDIFLWGPIFDAGHFCLFFLATLFLAQLLPAKPFGFPSIFGNPIAVATTVVLAIELVQPLVDRNASVTDIFNGLLGVAAAGIWLELLRTRASLRTRLLTALCFLALQLTLLLPTVSAARAIIWRRNHFPVLATFADPAEQRLWSIITPEKNSTRKTAQIAIRQHPDAQDGHALAVQTVPGFWAGVAYPAGNLSWQHFAALHFRIINPGPEAFELHVRIDDNEDCSEFEDRFNGTLQLAPGVNELKIPIAIIRQGPRNRELTVSRVRRMLLFTNKKDPARTFLIDDIRLQGAPKART